MITNNTESRQSKYDAIIILGNSPNWNDKPNPFLKSRLDTGIDLLLQGKSDNIILTGTKKESNLSEAEIMNNYCLERGVPNRKILLEKSAKSTKENLLNCRKLMNAKNLKNALVITSGHHTSHAMIRECLLRQHSRYSQSVSCNEKIKNESNKFRVDSSL